MTPLLSHTALFMSTVFFDTIWEGALIAGALWLVLLFLPRISAATRYAVWLAGVISLVAIPILTASISARATPVAQPLPARVVSDAPATVRGTRPEPSLATPTHVATEASAPVAAESLRSRLTIPLALALAIAALWTLVALFKIARLAMDFGEIGLIRRQSSLWSQAYDFPVYLSDRVRVPIAVGFLNRAVILPETFVKTVDERALEGMLIHEIAHLHRLDVWTNAFAQMIAAVLALNPAAWFLTRQLTMEREIACDDWIVARSNSRDAFARALASIASNTSERLALAAPGAIGSRRALVQRLAQLMDDARPRSLRFSAPILSAAIAMLTAVALLLQGVSPALALSQQPTDGIQTVASATQGCTKRFGGPWHRHTYGPGGPEMGSPSLPADVLRTFVARDPADTVTYQVAVDAEGHASNFRVLHASAHPSLDASVKESVMADHFEPKVVNCQGVAATFASAVTQYATPKRFNSVARLSIPNARPIDVACTTARHNPSISRIIEAQYPAEITALAPSHSFVGAVMVKVDAAGHVTQATSIGVPRRTAADRAFDQLLVLAAKSSTYSPGCPAVASQYILRSAFTEWLEP